MNNRFVLAYSLNGKVYLKPQGERVRAIAEGVAPAISPSQEKVAFLKQGNVFLYPEHHTNRQFTSIPTTLAQHSPFPLSVAWHPSEEYLLFVRVEPYMYDIQAKRLVEQRGTSLHHDVVGITTVWLVHLSSNRCRRIFTPWGDIPALYRSGQLEGAGWYEPVFSPDGRWIWVLHEGNLYQTGFEAKSGAVNTPRLARSLGTGFDMESPGASKAGNGAIMLAWDSKRGRLVYWRGRFWGTGVSEYGYLPWWNGKLDNPCEWQPPFALSVRRQGRENISGCVVDREGHLWVKVAQGGGNSRWMRADGRGILPARAERPSF